MEAPTDIILAEEDEEDEEERRRNKEEEGGGEEGEEEGRFIDLGSVLTDETSVDGVKSM